MLLKSAFEKLFKIREEAGRARKEGSGADAGFDPHEKPFLEHLEDLRKTLMQMVGTLLAITIFTFVFNQQIFDFVLLPLKVAKIDDSGTRLYDVANLLTLSPQEMLMLAIKTSFIAGLILAFPLLVYQLFQFILPGLRQVEKKMVIPGALVGFLLFLGGASFAFFLASPIALKFFYEFEQERVGSIDPSVEALKRPIAEFTLIGLDGKPIPVVGEEPADPPAEGETAVQENPVKPVEPAVAVVESTLDEATKKEVRDYILSVFAFREGSEIALRYDETRDKVIILKVKGKTTEYRMGDYINFVTRLVLVFGISFQLPVVVTILVKLELLTARVMRATRAYAWVIMMVAAAIFTPPDILTLGLLAGPLIFLYEVCIVIATVMERGRTKKERAREEARKTRLEKLYERKAEDLSEEEKAELHKHEIEQYEKEHADLHDDDHADDHADNPYADPYHNDPYHDEYGHPIDDPHANDHKTGDDHDHPEHDESWTDDHHHDEHGNPDPHHGEDEHKPVQDWPDREDGDDADSKPDADEDKPVLESDQAEPTEVDETNDDHEHDEFDDEEVCAPSGPIVDLNHSDFEEIMNLPGMDEELAQMIIDHRPYDSFDDVEDVPGMDPDRLADMIERLMLG